MFGDNQASLRDAWPLCHLDHGINPMATVTGRSATKSAVTAYLSGIFSFSQQNEDTNNATKIKTNTQYSANNLIEGLVR